MAPSVSPARTNSWTAWRSSMLSILRGPPVVGTGPYLEAGTYLRMPGGRTEFREKSGQNLENQHRAMINDSAACQPPWLIANTGSPVS
jgi:hypothetical protein